METHEADSHKELPVVEHPPERLREHEMAPFRAAIAADVAAVMTAHVLYTALDDERPATLSRAIVDEILRRELGHQGLVVTDDLDMGAIAGLQTVEQAAVRALDAGCDTVLVCGDSIGRHAEVLEAIIHAVETDELDGRLVEAAWGSATACEGQVHGGRTPQPAGCLAGRCGPGWARPSTRRWLRRSNARDLGAHSPNNAAIVDILRRHTLSSLDAEATRSCARRPGRDRRSGQPVRPRHV